MTSSEISLEWKGDNEAGSAKTNRRQEDRPKKLNDKRFVFFYIFVITNRLS